MCSRSLFPDALQTLVACRGLHACQGDPLQLVGCGMGDAELLGQLLLVAQAPPDTMDAERTYFRVVNSRPELKHCVTGAHMAKSRSVVAVVRCDKLPQPQSVTHFSSSFSVLFVDVKAWASIASLRRLVAWQECDSHPVLVPAPRMHAAMGGCAQLEDQAMEGSDADRSHTIQVGTHALLQYLDSINAYGDTMVGADPLDLAINVPGVSPGLIHFWVSNGLLVEKDSELGALVAINRGAVDVTIECQAIRWPWGEICSVLLGWPMRRLYCMALLSCLR